MEELQNEYKALRTKEEDYQHLEFRFNCLREKACRIIGINIEQSDKFPLSKLVEYADLKEKYQANNEQKDK